MRNLFFILLMLFAIPIFSQKVIKGTVYIHNGPIEDVAVYLNNSMLGTITNSVGKFQMEVKEGQYELIISYLGYKKIVYNLNTRNYSKPLVFVLEEEENILDEIIVKKIVYDNIWKHNLAVFKSSFIGTNEFAKNCIILNPEVLYFDDDIKNKTLKVYARKPLKIKNNKLGYIITYELESFIRDTEKITYLGYSRYQEMKGNKRKKRRWIKNRQIAYNGSSIHFFRAVLKNKMKKEGFIVNQFKRVPNPKRPSEEKIRRARTIVRNNKQIIINLSQNSSKKMTALDSAWAIVRKAKLPKFKDFLYKSSLKEKNIIEKRDNKYYLNFKDNLSVIYTKEKEEIEYANRGLFSKKRKPLSNQTSSIIPLEKDIALDKSGELVKPLAIFYEGYWSYEKFAYSLPLDYKSNLNN